jgi:hypothetical protein
MKIVNVEAARYARPFRPFEVRVDREVIPVRHPEQVLLAANKTTVMIDAVERIHIFEASQISKLTLLRGRSGASGGASQ